MEMIFFIPILITAYLGYVAGIIIARMAEEELKPGKAYFLLMQDALAAAISGIAMFYLGQPYYLIAAMGVFAILFLLRNPRSAYLLYPLFGVALFFTRENPTAVLLQASLIFIYGLPTAALLSSKPRKRPR